MWAKFNTLAVQTEDNPFLTQDLLDSFGTILIFMMDQLRPHLYNRHLAAKAPVHLGKLNTHVTSPDDHQVFWQEIDTQDGRICKVRNLVYSRQRRHYSTATHIDEDAVRT